ncbi:hypothetical protein MRB53_011217 [Persea americana]|uniref:Uncharacterized protein n=1 Tax=Persea americana TaxID=3435 RepID=A0ACC2LUA9_PERAE|nr:hypothetical protein MRB53_011217 [Persea americana]
MDTEEAAPQRKLQRYDSLDAEAAIISQSHGNGSKAVDMRTILILAFQSIGIVYGDLGTSPLYTFSGTFPNGIRHKDDILGALSLVYYTLILIPMIKYAFIVLGANDNGDGGTFALYSLICRYAKVGLLPSQEPEDRDISNYQLEMPSSRLRRASKVKSTLENSQTAKHFLLCITMLGTAMVIGDGIVTPSMSVLSAVGGIKKATDAMTEGRIVWVSIAILVLLFSVQRFGTAKVGYTFSPILTLWFFLISGIGIYNVVRHDHSVIKALNPAYIIHYFKKNKKDAWISLGGVILCTTGAEALFADLGHFTVRSIQISSCSLVFPSVVLAYTGQAAYLRKFPENVGDVFYKSIPGPLYWPMFVVAVLSAIIASQSLISAAFSIIQQSLALGCFPPVKVIHTSSKGRGGICHDTYIHIAGAYNANDMENSYSSYNCIHHYNRKYTYEFENKVPVDELRQIMANPNFRSLPGIAFFYSELVQGIPPIFKHYTENVPSLHSVVIFVSIKSLHIRTVPLEERFLFRRVHPRELMVFRCIVRYGYMDLYNDESSLERAMVDRLREFIREELRALPAKCNSKDLLKNGSEMDEGETASDQAKEEDIERREVVEREVEFVDREYNERAVHLFGVNEVVASKGSSFGKKVMIEYAYNFLKRLLRHSNDLFGIPHKRVLRVGMNYEL